MPSYAFKTAIPWYTMVIREQDGCSSHDSAEIRQTQDQGNPYLAGNKANVLVDLRNDYAFKLLFGSKGNERILIDFLNTVLKLPPGKHIREVTLINTEISKQFAEDKKSILDLLVATNDGDHINIEIQLSNKYDMPVRSLYYGARIIGKEILEGEQYLNLKHTIMINLVNFVQFNTTNSYHTRFELYDSEAKVKLTDRLQVHFVELPKFLEQWKRKQLNPRVDRLARWLLLLEVSEDGMILPELEEIAMQGDSVLSEALDKWDEMSRDPNVRLAYEMRFKQLKDEAIGMKEAIYMAEIKAKAEGEAKGLAIGEAKGLAIGEAKGKAGLIQSMLANGVSIKQISAMTGLSMEEIESIQGSNIV